MTEVGDRNLSTLNWDVLITPGIPIVTSDLPPGTETGDVSGDNINPHLWQARRRSSRRLYDRQAS